MKWSGGGFRRIDEFGEPDSVDQQNSGYSAGSTVNLTYLDLDTNEISQPRLCRCD